ncbi:Protein of unknown function, partial [Gryllus bimaculatus]
EKSLCMEHGKRRISENSRCAFWKNHCLGAPHHWKLEFCNNVVDRQNREGVEHQQHLRASARDRPARGAGGRDRAVPVGGAGRDGDARLRGHLGPADRPSHCAPRGQPSGGHRHARAHHALQQV